MARKSHRAVLGWHSCVLACTKLEEVNAEEKVKRLAFNWRRLNFERPSPECVQYQIRTSAGFSKWHVSARFGT